MSQKRNEAVRKLAQERLKNVDTCSYCGRKGKVGKGKQDPDRNHWCMDHVYPLDKGGEDSLRNLVKSCWSCNETKAALLWRPRADAITAAFSLAVEEIATRGPTPELIRPNQLKPNYRPPYQRQQRKKKPTKISIQERQSNEFAERIKRDQEKTSSPKWVSAQSFFNPVR